MHPYVIKEQKALLSSNKGSVPYENNNTILRDLATQGVNFNLRSVVVLRCERRKYRVPSRALWPCLGQDCSRVPHVICEEPILHAASHGNEFPLSAGTPCILWDPIFHAPCPSSCSLHAPILFLGAAPQFVSPRHLGAPFFYPRSKLFHHNAGGKAFFPSPRCCSEQATAEREAGRAAPHHAQAALLPHHVRLARHSQPLKLQQSEMEPRPCPALSSPWKKGANSQLKLYRTYLGQCSPKAQLSPALRAAPKCLCLFQRKGSPDAKGLLS